MLRAELRQEFCKRLYSPASAPEGSDSLPSGETDGHDEDTLSQIEKVVPLADHLRHVTAEAELLCGALDLETGTRAVPLPKLRRTTG